MGTTQNLPICLEAAKKVVHQNEHENLEIKVIFADLIEYFPRRRRKTPNDEPHKR